MNQVCLVGRLTSDPEVKQTTTGMLFTSFNIAVDRGIKRDPNNPDQVTADFPTIKAFSKTAEFIGNYFKKGQRIGITGRIQTGKYTNKDGQTVYTTDVIADRVEFVENKGTSLEQPQPERATAPTRTTEYRRNDSFMNIPQGVDEELPFT